MKLMVSMVEMETRREKIMKHCHEKFHSYGNNL